MIMRVSYKSEIFTEHLKSWLTLQKAVTKLYKETDFFSGRMTPPSLVPSAAASFSYRPAFSDRAAKPEATAILFWLSGS